MLDILYQDDHYVAINKPAGLLVHRSSIARDASEFALQLTRDQLGREVHPVHRLDRKTSGVLLFAFDLDALRKLQATFNEDKVLKRYLALVRGFIPDQGEIDYALVNDKGKVQEARTSYVCLNKYEISRSSGKFPTSRYSYVEVFPKTGRMHQIRKHFAHIFHPIVGDRPHGCNKQNKFFKEEFELHEMLLHAESYSFQHPFKKEEVSINAPLRNEFNRIKNRLEELNVIH